MIVAESVGFEELAKKLEKTLPKTAKKAIRKGVSKGSQLLAKKAKGRVHRGHGGVPGLLKKSIGQKVKTYRRSGEVVGVIGPRVGFLHILNGGKRVDPVKYGHIEEKGRRVVVAEKRFLSDGKTIFGKKVRAYQGRPFMRPTIEQDGHSAAQRMAEETAKVIETEAKKK